MPASSPWIDRAAPAQWTLGSQQTGPAVNASANNNTVDTTLHWKLSGTILLALLVVFGLQLMGFRFVTSANATIGVGR